MTFHEKLDAAWRKNHSFPLCPETCEPQDPLNISLRGGMAATEAAVPAAHLGSSCAFQPLTPMVCLGWKDQ